MHVDLTPEQKALQQELRSYFTNLMTPEVKARIRGAEEGENKEYKELIRQIGRDGWLGVGWPKEYGGKDFTAIENYIFFNEAQAAGCPIPFLTTNTVGPTIRQFGSPEQKEYFLTRILKGELHFSIGYSEPEAGTDLASLRTRAVRDGDEFVVDGNKVFTSGANTADHIWLAARTNPDAPKHKGISILIVDMKSPGITVEPLHLLSTHDINATFFDDVRVPAANVVGGENNGWGLIMNQLNHERVTLCSSGLLEQSYVEVRRWAQQTQLADGRRVVDQEWVQLNLARVHAGLEFLRLINWKVAWTATQGRLDIPDASTIKVFGTEFYLEAFRLLMEVLGPRAYLERSSPASILKGRLEMNFRSLLILTFGGGTNEIQRDLIGMFGLGLPRALRG